MPKLPHLAAILSEDGYTSDQGLTIVEKNALY